MKNQVAKAIFCVFISGVGSFVAGSAAAQCVQPAPAQVGTVNGGVGNGIVAYGPKVLEAELAMLIRLNECSASINKELLETIKKAGESREKLQSAVAALIATSKDLP